MQTGLKGYPCALIGPQGIKLAWDPERPSNKRHWIIPGQACEFVGTEALLSSILPGIDLDKRGIWGTVTRSDFAMDASLSFAPSPSEIFNDIKADRQNVRTTAKTFRIIEEHTPGDEKALSQTLYVGSRSSSRLLRYYTSRGHARFELQCNKEASTPLFVELARAYQLTKQIPKIPGLVVGLIRSYVDFVEPSINTTRSTLVSWWDHLVGDVSRFKVARKKLAQTVETAKRWLLQAVASTLAMVLKADEGETNFLGELFDHGEDNLNPRHHRIIDQYRKAINQAGNANANRLLSPSINHVPF
jgi:DNA relaxase NicK